MSMYEFGVWGHNSTQKINKEGKKKTLVNDSKYSCVLRWSKGAVNALWMTVFGDSHLVTVLSELEVVLSFCFAPSIGGYVKVITV